MSLESHRGGLFIVANGRKRERSLSSVREEYLLSEPLTPPATETERRGFDGDDWGEQIMREWGDSNVSVEYQEPSSKRSSRILPWAHDDNDALLHFQQDCNSISNLPEDGSSKTDFPFAMSTVDLSGEESCNNIGAHSSELLTLSREDIEDIVNAADVTSSSGRSDDNRPAIILQPLIRDFQSGGVGEVEDAGSNNLPNGDSEHHSRRLAEEERSVGSPP